MIKITINSSDITLSIGDKIIIREYKTTYGSYVPATPSMLGLYQVYMPREFLDNTYVEPTNVIQGHDGSITVSFPDGDYRNSVLLEFEKRCYNNIKLTADEKYNPILQAVDVIPGQFRTTDYTLTEINDILNVSFLAWVGDQSIVKACLDNFNEERHEDGVWPGDQVCNMHQPYLFIGAPNAFLHGLTGCPAPVR